MGPTLILNPTLILSLTRILSLTLTLLQIPILSHPALKSSINMVTSVRREMVDSSPNGTATINATVISRGLQTNKRQGRIQPVGACLSSVPQKATNTKKEHPQNLKEP